MAQHMKGQKEEVDMSHGQDSYQIGARSRIAREGRAMRALACLLRGKASLFSFFSDGSGVGCETVRRWTPCIVAMGGYHGAELQNSFEFLDIREAVL